MSEGFAAYKVLAFAIIAAVFVGMAAPDIGSNFDPLRARGRASTEFTNLARTPEDGWPRLFTSLLSRSSDRPAPGSSSDAASNPNSSGGSTGSTGATNPLYSEESTIASNFNVSSYLRPSWGTGAIPADNGVDPVGAFRFICGAGQISYDDPMVYPNQPGASHLHQFYGNTSADAYSTYSSLRQNGESTCGNKVNRSGYWMPALLDGKGNVVKPDYVSIYYKRIPLSNPRCAPANGVGGGVCVPIPNGLRFIFGYDMVTNTAPTGDFHFLCQNNGHGTGMGTFKNLADVAAAGCPAGNQIEAIIQAPRCWDGKHLDTPNHRDHVAYETNGACDSAHPYLMPTFTLAAFYSVAKGDDLKLWHFSSDEMVRGAPAGSTFHADFFDAWDDGVMAMWMDNCINKHLNCSGGDLGNGLQISGGAHPSYGWSNPDRLVPVPPRP